MVRIFFFLVFTQQLFAGDFDPLKTTKANKAKEQASEAYVAQKYDVAIGRYKYLLDTLKIKNEKVLLNLAHCYMRKADYTNAQNTYTDATKAGDPKIRSLAFQQLGILQSEKKNKEEALNCFKEALKNDPSNAQARYNYELLKKAKEKEMPKSDDKKDRDEQEKKDQEQKKKNEEQKKKDEQKKQDQGDKDKKDKDKDKQGDKEGNEKDEKGEDGKKDNKDGKNDLKEKDKESKDGKPDDQKKENKDGKKDEGDKEKKAGDEKKEGEGDKGKENKPDEKGDKKAEAEKPSDKGDKKKNTESEATTVNKEQLQKMNMTEQQAKSILNAMRQGEAQYIQQMKRVPAKPHSTKGKKDW